MAERVGDLFCSFWPGDMPKGGKGSGGGGGKAGGGKSSAAGGGKSGGGSKSKSKGESLARHVLRSGSSLDVAAETVDQVAVV